MWFVSDREEIVVVVVRGRKANRGQRAVSMRGMVWAHRKVLFSATHDGRSSVPSSSVRRPSSLSPLQPSSSRPPSVWFVSDREEIVVVIVVVVVVVEGSQAYRGQSAVSMRGMVWAHRGIIRRPMTGEAAAFFFCSSSFFAFSAAASSSSFCVVLSDREEIVVVIVVVVVVVEGSREPRAARGQHDRYGVGTQRSIILGDMTAAAYLLLLFVVLLRFLRCSLLLLVLLCVVCE